MASETQMHAEYKEMLSLFASRRVRQNHTIDRQTVHFISKTDLIKTKKKAGRPQDLIDLDHLTVKSWQWTPPKSVNARGATCPFGKPA